MASYHSSFTYLNKNSADEGFLLLSFEPDNGFKDSFLGMDQVYEDYYDGTKKFLYGTKYNTSATISITLVKADGSDFTMADNRRVFKWLTGARTASWLDFYPGAHKDVNNEDVEPQYSFLGTMSSNPQQYKLDGRVIGISIEFASISPWAYSPPQSVTLGIKQSLTLDSNGILLYSESGITLGISDDGTLLSSIDSDSSFGVTDDGVIVISENANTRSFTNNSDDLYTYIYFDIDYTNDPASAGSLTIENKSLGEICEINNIDPGERIVISGKQFIVSYTQDQTSGEWVQTSRIFGDDFNFVWPRIQPGDNELIVGGSGTAEVTLTYRYPMKVGDCAMDISVYGGDIGCGDCGEIPSYDTVKWANIIDTPTSISGYGITDAYTKTEVDDAIDNIEVSGGGSSGGTGSGDASIDESDLNDMLNDVLGG